MKLGEALKEAYDKAGISLPEKKDREPTVIYKKRSTLKKEHKNITDGDDKKNKKKDNSKSAARITKTKRRTGRKHCQTKHFSETVENRNTTYTSSGIKVIRNTSASEIPENNKISNLQKNKPLIENKSVHKKTPIIKILPGARVIWTGGTQLQTEILSWKQNGSSVDLGNTQQEKHLYIGLDFGTSTIKAVVHDKERRRSFAVPFRKITGIQGYLLPCHLRKVKNVYSLKSGTTVSQDLKLSLLAKPDDRQTQQHVVAFLALALQQIRSWLLSEHGDIYSGSIIWYMTLGLPVAHNREPGLVELFTKLGTAAWIASTNEEISQEKVEWSIGRAEQLELGEEPDYNEDIAVDVEPEIAAQIYGFVSSTAYDPHAKNFYLIVDVGAGTLDASIFHIRRNARKLKQANFSIFRTTIEPFGVMNWHSERISWLLENLQKHSSATSELLQGLKTILRVTDSVEPIPNKINGYFENLTIKTSKEQCIDTKFYKKVRSQVAANTYMYIEKNKLIERKELTGIPMFLCGGGSRIPLYRKLKKDMKEAPNYRWFGATAQQLHKPESLLAPGLKTNDYDRLSVAYGLSQMKSGTINYEVPPLEEAPSTDYQDRYISKDYL